ncbi:hypothetical protein OCOJLMKI_2772 [Methylobacterium iners]|uniref:Uncharacterized protein n=1 Tax=Methylobacterium iners TaxID=418707 RepID=A0ABQ4RXN6_9HYPH|nr:hypothetical protein [Methylobacterium iners]GJD95559.1 hypothetical protein OCOJLMKI_2772 [Methylobacterium iners]
MASGCTRPPGSATRGPLTVTPSERKAACARISAWIRSESSRTKSCPCARKFCTWLIAASRASNSSRAGEGAKLRLATERHGEQVARAVLELAHQHGLLLL